MQKLSLLIMCLNVRNTCSFVKSFVAVKSTLTSLICYTVNVTSWYKLWQKYFIRYQEPTVTIDESGRPKTFLFHLSLNSVTFVDVFYFRRCIFSRRTHSYVIGFVRHQFLLPLKKQVHVHPPFSCLGINFFLSCCIRRFVVG